MKTSEVYSTPLDEKFERFSGTWEQLLSEWEKLADVVPDTKHAYEMAYAAAIKVADGTAQVKEATATLATRREYLEQLKAEARLEFVKAKIKWLDKEMSILQTRAANSRAEMAMTALPEQRWSAHGR